MFEGFISVPLHFTVEFLGFLVTAGGAFLAFSRPSLVPGPSSNRVAASLGLIALAAAQVMHGGAFIEADGDEIIAAVRALGFALLLIGIVGDFKPAAAAFVGYELEEPLLLVPAGAALLMSMAALSAARRESTRFYNRLALAGLLLAASEVAIGAAPNEIFGGGSVDRFLLIAHGLKFVGYVALGSWLWSAVRSSIRTRFVASFGVLLVSVILALSTALTGVIANNVQTQELDRVRDQAANFADDYSFGGDQDVRELNNVAENMATRLENVVPRFAARDRLRRLARELRRSPLVDVDEVDFVIVDHNSPLPPQSAGSGPHVFNRQGSPVPTNLGPKERLLIVGSDVVRDVARGRVEGSASPTRIEDQVAVIAAHSVEDGGRLVGVIIVGKWIDALEVEQIRKDAAGADVTLFVQNRKAATTLRRGPARDLKLDADRRSQLRTDPGISDPITLGSSSYYAGFAGVTDGDGTVVATLVISPESALVVDTSNPITKILFLAATLVGAIAILLAYFSGRRITRPIQALTQTAGAVREGDLSARAEVAGEDEVGQLGETFNQMTESLLRFTDDLRKAARQEHDLRARIETIIRSMADGLVAVDADLNVLAFNPEAERITGVSSGEAIGEPVASVVEVRDSHGEPVELPVFSLAEGSLADVYVQPRDGEQVPVAVTSAILRGEEDDITGGVAVIRNMTREREIERMKTEFLSNISHELRTPLTPIKGYAEILGRKSIPFDKVKTFVQGILDSTGRLERIVELLVDFSAMEAGRLAPRAGQVDVGNMLTSLAERWSPRCPNHEMVTELPEGEALQVIGDERLLRRSLDEILDNAVKFSPNGGTIRLAAKASGTGNGAAEGRFVEMSVTDQGIGIPPDDLTKIFSDFQQLDGSETRAYGGLGLGLAFVQRIVEAHKGALRVESEPEAGTRLSITIPAAEQAPQQTEQVGD